MKLREKAQIMDGLALGRAVTRIAHEIIEHNRGTDGVVLLGIRRRGEPLARRIADKIRDIEGREVPVGAVDITYYRDDLSRIGQQPVLNSPEIGVEVAGRHVVLLDDVIFTGRTVRAAIEAVFRCGRPDTVQLAVMIDRGLRELPIRPDYVGKNIPTSRSEVVSVRLREIDGEDGVSILSREGGGGAD